MSNQLSSAMSFLTMSYEVVTIRVGKPEVSIDFQVYRDLLISVSAYFRGAFAGGFKEAVDGVIPLTDVSEGTFRVFLQWAHAQMFSPGSGALIPDPSIFSPLPPGEDSTQTDPLKTKRILPNKAFDELDYQTQPLSDSQLQKLYEDERWTDKYRMGVVSYLSLYIFADKYSVHQLRDDIMTAMLGQTYDWNWFPEPDEDLLILAYDNLPESAKFLRFMVLCAAYCWVTEDTADCRERLALLRLWRQEFALEVAVALAEAVQINHKDEPTTFPGFLGKDSQDSCVFHEHLEHDKDSCRKRIRNKAHVFAELIEACARDGISMAMEHTES